MKELTELAIQREECSQVHRTSRAKAPGGQCPAVCVASGTLAWLEWSKSMEERQVGGQGKGGV